MKKVTIILAVLLVAAIVCAGVFASQKGNLNKTISELSDKVAGLTSDLEAKAKEATDNKSLADEAAAALETAKTELETLKTELAEAKANLEAALKPAEEPAEEAAPAEEPAEEAAPAEEPAEEAAPAEEPAAEAAAVESAPAAAGKVTIAVPNDPTNEGRALLLLQANGILTLKEDAGITATKNDVASTNGVEIEFVEMEAALVPTVVQDVDYAIINNNYALDAGMNPVKDSLLIESADSPYVNVVCVKAGNESSDLAKALAAAVTSKQVADFINATYDGAAVSTVEALTDGYDAALDYAALEGKTITIGCSPTPHADILNVAKEILAAKGITLEITQLTDYVTPNTMVEDEDLFANYFAHQPYQDNFNAENGTHIVTIAGVHVEPMAMYGGAQKTLEALGVKAE